MNIEKGVGFKNVFSDFRRDLHSKNFASGIVAGIFGLSVGLVFISAGTAAGLSSELIMMWLTSFVFINGLFGILMASYYRQPLAMANSIPGALLFTAAVPMVGLGPVLGATLIAGVITLLVGISGLMGKVMHFTPTPIIMGMIAGVLLSFGLDMFRPLESAFVPALLMIGTYLILTRVAPRFPAVLGSLIVGIFYLTLTGVDISGIEFTVQYPTFVMPEFTLEGFLTYGLPLAIILIGMETPVGVSLLQSVGYKRLPINGMTTVTGISTMISSFFHLHSTCVAAPMTAICSSPESGKRETRWVAAVIVGMLFMAASPVYGAIVGLLHDLPGFFIAIIAGLPLLTVLISTLTKAFDHSHKVGAIFAFLIAASDVTIFSIGAPLWALVFGIIASLLVEPKDFNLRKKEKIDIAA
ncbi:benzoate/H(+) symporter BenE family transporter [Desertibacillus haloalkaliphilus]|uniref:benzoate/H(+) symporter BenE family transporter n=1 Tax=Desertibacillus haloalkaliphilus TaxID=1328930 RepID=UPI001C27266F|nr:benzoate/H(+) symporter BenE family transporter [Desertibacillus haloalkaliphilus]MBU8908374.1 benzoate/H(+) symporter BenE family transporter [Desertibacillus haloalkaliphilus]